MDLKTFILVGIISIIASFISGTTGVGGSAIMTVTLTALLGGELAVPILTLVMLVSNLARAFCGRKEIDWKNVKLFLVLSLPLSLLGALGFTLLPQSAVNKVIGISILVFIAFSYYRKKEIKMSNKAMLIGGGISGFISGFVGSSGPISAVLFFSLNLSPVGYVASEAMAVSVLHIGKIIVYKSMMDIELNVWLLGLSISVFMIVGTVLANLCLKKFNLKAFHHYVSLAIALMAVYLIFK